jgi:hypothetical protein
MDVLFWILFSLVLLTIIPDRWHVRREIAKRQAAQRAALIRESAS